MLTAKTYLLHLGMLVLLLGGLVGCNGSPQLGDRETAIQQKVNVSAIEVVQQEQQTDSTVYVRGKVGKRAPFLGSQAYELQDTTGTIWIVTTEAVPPTGTEVLVKGQVRYQSISLAGQEAGEVYVEELEQFAN